VRRPLLHLPARPSLVLARLLGGVMSNPPITVDNVLGLTSPARVDRQATLRDFPIAWTPLAVGLRAFAPRSHRRATAMPPTVAGVPELEVGVGPSRPVRVAIVGLGRMGVAHAAVLSMLPGTSVVGAVDSQRGAARRLHGMGFRVPVAPTLDALFA